MRSNYDVREVYTGDGIQASFTFDFKIANLAHLLVTHVDPTGVQLWQSRGTETTYYTTVLNEDGLGGTITWVTGVPASLSTVIVLLADDEPKQESKYTADSRYTMKKIENTFDALSGQIQRIRYLLDRSLRLPEKWTTALTTELPEVITEAVPMVNAAGTAITLIPRSEFKGDAGNDGLSPNFYFSVDDPDPGIGDTGDIWVVSTTGELYKHTSGVWVFQGLLSGGVTADTKEYGILESYENPPLSGTFSTRWTDALVYNGFSTRFSSLVNLQGLKATLDYVMNMGYVAPNLSLTGSVSTALREIGNTIASVVLTGTFTKTLDDLATIRFYQGALLDTQAIGPGSGSANFTYSTPFSTNTTFTAQVDDISAQPKPSKTASLTYSFVYPYYYGAGAAGKTGAQIRSDLSMDIINNTNNYSKTLVSAGSQKLYVAYPASYGALTSILDANLFEVISTFTATTTNITGLDGNPVSYRIYESNNLVIAGSFAFQFKK